jgi:hypothetical protein
MREAEKGCKHTCKRLLWNRKPPFPYDSRVRTYTPMEYIHISNATLHASLTSMFLQCKCRSTAPKPIALYSQKLFFLVFRYRYHIEKYLKWNVQIYVRFIFYVPIFGTKRRVWENPSLSRKKIQWVPGDLSLGVKRPVRDADHSSPSSDEVKECVELYLHSPNTSSWGGA